MRPSSRTLAAWLLLASCLARAAGEAAPAAAPAPATAPAAEAPVAAAAQGAERDPFWPVGYAPQQASAAEPQAAPTETAPDAKPKTTLQIDNLSPEQQAVIRNQLRISGIMRFGPDYVARVNGQLASAGDELTAEVEGQRVVFVIRSITKDAVQLEPKR